MQKTHEENLGIPRQTVCNINAAEKYLENFISE